MTENPASCPKCGALWDFGTDPIGRLVALHPVTRCIPRPARVYEKEDEGESAFETRRCRQKWARGIAA